MPMDTYYDQEELEQLDCGKKIRIKGAGLPVMLLASVLAPVLKKMITGKGRECSCKDIESKLVGSGLFRNFVKSILKTLAKKGIEKAKDFALEKSSGLIKDTAQYLDEGVDALASGRVPRTPPKPRGGRRLVKPPKDVVADAGACSRRASRNAVVAKIMKSKKLSLPEASKYVKDHCVPY